MTSFLVWIANHSGGYEMIVPLLLVATALGTWFVRSGRRSLAPYAILPCWAISAVLYYRAMQIDRFWYYDRTRWVAISGSLLFLLAIPFAAVAILLLLERVGRLRPIPAAAVSAIGGLVGIPVAGLVSGVLADLVLPVLSGR